MASLPQEIKKAHTIKLDNRKSLQATGVIKTINYDEYAVSLETDWGILLIGGTNLSVNEISTQTGDISIEGNIEYIQYQKQTKKSQGGDGFFKRLVR